MLGLSRMRKARRRFATAFVSTKMIEANLRPELNSQNEDYGVRRLWDDGARSGCDFALPPNETAARAALSKRALPHSCLIRCKVALTGR